MNVHNIIGDSSRERCDAYWYYWDNYVNVGLIRSLANRINQNELDCGRERLDEDKLKDLVNRMIFVRCEKFIRTGVI